MSDKSYPYIGKSKRNDLKVIFISRDHGVEIESGIYTGVWSEPAFRNITREYLQNTYGEVKNKRHAEFLIELAENNGFVVVGEPREGAASFSICDDEIYFYKRNVFQLLSGILEQITIPEPPESWKPDDNKEEWPKAGDEVAWGTSSSVSEVIAIDNGFAWVKVNNNTYVTAETSSLRKPKTPEEELQDDIYSIIHGSASGLATKTILEKYNITKKES